MALDAGGWRTRGTERDESRHGPSSSGGWACAIVTDTWGGASGAPELRTLRRNVAMASMHELFA